MTSQFDAPRCSHRALCAAAVGHHAGKCLHWWLEGDVDHSPVVVCRVAPFCPTPIACLLSRFNEKIKTEHEFVRAGFHWAGPQIAWALSLATAQVSDDRAMYARFETIPDVERLHNMSLTRRYGIGIERLHANSYSFGEYVRMDSLDYQDVSVFGN